MNTLYVRRFRATFQNGVNSYMFDCRNFCRHTVLVRWHGNARFGEVDAVKYLMHRMAVRWVD